MNECVIKCKNVTKGQFRLITGKYYVCKPLLDTISLLTSIPNNTGFGLPKLKYDLEIMEFLDKTTMLSEKEYGIAFPDKRYTAISPRYIAKIIAKEWIDNNYTLDNYGVAGTHWLLEAAIHEALHTHVWRQYQGLLISQTISEAIEAEEKQVFKIGVEMYAWFMKEYGMEFEATTFMWGLITEELSTSARGRSIIERQVDWLSNSIVSEDRDGTQVITIREDYRLRYMPTTDWKPVKLGLKAGLEKIFRDPTIGSENPAPEPAVFVAEEVAPTPPVVAVNTAPISAYNLPPTPAAVAAIAPAPPAQVITEAPAPPPPVMETVPLAVYEENMLSDEDRLFAISEGRDPNAVSTPRPAMTPDIITAIQQSATYNPVPINAGAGLESIVQLIGVKICNHIFLECGWDPEVGFTNPDGVHKDIDFRDIPGADAVIRDFQVYDTYGRVTKSAFRGTVRGKITKENKMPMYDLTFQRDGIIIHRRYLPQNINSEKTPGVLSWSAKRARKGDRIMWVLDPEVDNFSVTVARSQGNRGTKFVGKYVAGCYTPITK